MEAARSIICQRTRGKQFVEKEKKYFHKQISRFSFRKSGGQKKQKHTNYLYEYLTHTFKRGGRSLRGVHPLFWRILETWNSGRSLQGSQPKCQEPIENKHWRKVKHVHSILEASECKCTTADLE